MALFCAKARCLPPLSLSLALSLAVAALAAAAPAPQTPQRQALSPLPRCNQPVNLDAASSSLDLASKTYVFTDIVITQCTLRLQADHARGTSPVNFSNSHWTFDGHVRMDAEQRGSLRSDQALVEFRDNRIARATVTGKPAEFQQQRSDSQQEVREVRGRANEIVYDVTDGTIRLTNDAWLSDGQNEISGPLLVYNIRAQRVQAATTPGTGQRVHITIAPQTVPSGKGNSEPAKPPPNPQP